MPEGFITLAELVRGPREPDAEVPPVPISDREEETLLDERAARRLRARLQRASGFGRAFDADGTTLDDGSFAQIDLAPCDAPRPLDRIAPEQVAWTGVRAIDALLAIARGARVGIFGAPGTGKSSLLEAIVRGFDADATIVALVGERGREAERWIRTRDPYRIVICATSDRTADERIRACEGAFAHAARLRDAGLHVALVVDNLARYATALREAAIGAGEACGRGGFPPSVFARLARTLELAGATAAGSVTVVAGVLDDGDERDPVSDAARSLLDGHLQLSPLRARAGAFPAIDVLASTSRTMNAVATPVHRRMASRVRAAIGRLAETEEARALGLAGESAALELAVAAEPAIEALLRQGAAPEPPERTLAVLAAIADTLGEDDGH